MRKAQKLSKDRFNVSREEIEDWYAEQKSYLEKKNLLNISPRRILKNDETHMLLSPELDVVFAPKGARSVYRVSDNEKEGITVLFNYNAAGDLAPPMLLFPYNEEVPDTVARNTPRGWGIGTAENGWMTTESFYDYLTKVFYPWLVNQDIEFPVVLFLDNHNSHITIPAVEFGRAKQIEIIGLIPNSTHIMQPLDISFFRPFKLAWQKAVVKWKNQNNVTKLPKERIGMVIQAALDLMNDNVFEIIKNGFRSAGLYPFNPNAVDLDLFARKGKSKKPSKLAAEQAPSSIDQSITNEQALEHFEKSIQEGLIEVFKEAMTIGVWYGDAKYEGLFEYWLKLKNPSSTGILYC